MGIELTRSQWTPLNLGVYFQSFYQYLHLGGVTQYCSWQERCKASDHHAPVSQGWACWRSVTQTTKSEGTQWDLLWEDLLLASSSGRLLGGSCTSLWEKQHRSWFLLSWLSPTAAFSSSFSSLR